MPTPTLYAAKDGIVQYTLLSPYVPGSGQAVLTSIGNINAFPAKFTMILAAGYNTGPSEVSSVYQCTGATGNTLTGVSVLAGSVDQAFPAGSYVEERVNAVDQNSLITVVAPMNITPANGVILIGNGQPNGWVPATLAQGANITITNGPGTITIAAAGGSGGGGTVTTVSINNANGFSATVVNQTTAPAFNLMTTVTGMIKGNGNALMPATAGSDYQAPIALTTAGTTGPATFNAATGALNIPSYTGGTGSVGGMLGGWVQSPLVPLAGGSAQWGPVIAPFAGTISAVQVVALTNPAGSGGGFSFNISRNSGGTVTNLFAAAQTLAAGVTTAQVFIPTLAPILKNDVLTLTTSAAGTGVAGVMIQVTV